MSIQKVKVRCHLFQKVPYCLFLRHPANFKVTWAKKSTKCFRTVNPVEIHIWLWNNAQSLKWIYLRPPPGMSEYSHLFKFGIMCCMLSMLLMSSSLTHWGRDEMNNISQTTFSNVFSSMKMFEFRLKFHWSLFPRVQLTIFQHWFR